MSSEVEETLKRDHEGDENQLNTIFTHKKKVVVEAPAGCGKTKTMVSKVSYILATKQISENKKILALTFSVNAAYKMKKDICDKLPRVGIDSIKTPAEINKKIYITNYHGFARRLLHLYGYLLDEKLKNFDGFQAINEENIDNLGLCYSDISLLHNFSEAVNNADKEYIYQNQDEYYSILKNKLLPNNYITYNGYLLLCKRILHDYCNLKAFFQRLYPIIIIDEFQDTNILSWDIIQELVTEDSQLFFMGDSLQRIYGFIGAIPNILDMAVDRFNMTKIVLTKNYRFRDNRDMLLLDKNIRKNAENFLNPSINEDAYVSLQLLNNQKEESKWVADKVQELLSNHENSKVAILVKQRGENINEILSSLDQNGVNYFYALFSDEDSIYIKYHEELLKIFFDELNNNVLKRINMPFLEKVKARISKYYEDNDNPVIVSLLILTKAFFRKMIKEYNFLNNEEKIAFINDTISNRALKQNMDEIDSRVIVSTVHGAKGLEWEYVILPDMEPYVFPNFRGLCGQCDFRRGRYITGDFCRIVPSEQQGDCVMEELSVFYVAVTRAKKQVFFSASKKRYKSDHEEKESHICCLLTLPGIKIS
ncbi:MAG: ATP-dependent helicase [Inconstantimicrobium porci]|uniref:ATP-dependent helicase n=1 Tax=Inconstantimicrobium porci TaxID=2652291 RepID=UPI002A90F8A3|nr:ATP-dependent helicase [Inconstantimicrobium porci]MDY5912611.1 ATP-dependent helicase [Inconstantimicrobium porci]